MDDGGQQPRRQGGHLACAGRAIAVLRHALRLNASHTATHRALATALTMNGEVEEARGVVRELLRLEREHFVALAQMPKTQERIKYTLANGKPLRN